ncbi:hypothetical protein HPB51_026444 [Rhipicephalus microplus]|uniref:DDE Tnp4 domain-containing protein n=1 Tax=Rhipicephalus microplus TaxID=6941 RepID=A0A9J6D3N1_RHIMP|nr:hypothetical protein HPB51_026444 [Rhipicephalus microplus]
MAAFAALAELLSSDESTSSSSSSSSDDEDFEERQALCEAFFRETFSESHRERPKILGFIENVARLYTDEQFRQDFRVSRRVAETLIRGFEGSRHYPCSDRGGSPSKTAEEHILVFLWFAANKACLRDVAGRFGMATATAFRVVERTLEYFLDIAEEVISFPGDLDQLSADFEQQDSRFENLQDIEAFFKVAACVLFREVPRSRGRCLPASRYLITPFRNYGHLDARQRAFNYHFSATRVKIENAFGDLKARFRQLLHLDFLFVDKMNKFIIACCVLHNMCINCGDVDVPPYIDDEHAPWNGRHNRMMFPPTMARLHQLKMHCVAKARRSVSA